MNVQPVKKCYYNSLDTEHRTFRCTHYVNETKLFCFLFCFVFFSHREHLAFIYLFTMMTVEIYLVLEVLMIMLTPLDMVLPMYQHKRTFRVLTVAKSISVRKLHSILFSISYFRVNCGIQGI